MSRRMIGAKLRDFLSDERAASPVEYALFVALIGGLALFGSEMLGVAARSAMAQAANAAAGGRSVRPAALNSPAATASPSPSLQPAAAETPIDWLLWLKWGAAAAVLAAGGWCWRVLYCRGRAEELEEELQQAESSAFPVVKLFEKRQAILKLLSKDMGCLLGNRVTVEHLMSTRLTTVGPDMTLEQIDEMMSKGKRRHLLVADEQGRLLGVISDRDVARRRGPTARALMTANPVSVDSKQLIGPAVTLLLERRISCLPVVEDGKLVGVLTKSDLLMALQCTLHLLCQVAVATNDSSEETLATTA